MKISGKKTFLFAFFCLLLTSMVHAQSPTVTVQAGYPVGRPANQVAYGNSKYVLLSAYMYNALFQSTTGTAWTRITTAGLSAAQLNFIAFGAGVFVTVGDNGTIQTSADGISWTSRTSGTTNRLSRIFFLNSKFFVIGDNRTLLTSADGISWSTITFNAGNAADFFMSLSYGNGVYVLSARNNSGGSALVYRSATAANNSWSYSTTAFPMGELINRIQFLNNRFFAYMAGNRMFNSNDGNTWTEFTNSVVLTQPNSTTTSWNASHQIFNGVWDGTKYHFYGSSQYYGGYGSTFSSADGINFTLLTKTAYIVPQESTIINGIYFICGNEGVATSTDGLTYKHSGAAFNDFVKTPNKYVAVGMVGNDGQIYNSTDFNSWTNRTPSNIRELYAVAYDGTNILAAGYVNILRSSDDGDSWTTVHSAASESYSSMAYGNGRFVIGGSDAASSFIRYSTDAGQNWTTASTENNYYYKIKYINNKFFALGINNDDYLGRILYSADGISWSDVTPNPGMEVMYYKDVAFDGTKYHVLGVESSAWVPVEFFTLSTATPENAASYGNKAVCNNTPADVVLGGNWDEGTLNYAAGKFTGSVIDVNTGQDYIITSADGSSWTALPQNSYSTISGAYYNGTTIQMLSRSNAFFTISYGGTLPVTNLRFNGSRYQSSVKLHWSTEAEQNTGRFNVQHSTDGVNWNVLVTVAASGNSSSLREYNFIHTTPAQGKNFYRLSQEDLDGRSSQSHVVTIYYGNELRADWYPNPVTSSITIRTSSGQKGRIIFFNTAGHLVKRAVITGNETRIDVSALPKGIYIAEIKQGIQTQKITVVKN